MFLLCVCLLCGLIVSTPFPYTRSQQDPPTPDTQPHLPTRASLHNRAIGLFGDVFILTSLEHASDVEILQVEEIHCLCRQLMGENLLSKVMAVQIGVAKVRVLTVEC